MHDVELQHATDFEGWRNAARGLLASGIAPQDVSWRVAGSLPDLFGDAATPSAPVDAGIRVPRAFVSLARLVILHSDPQRFALLYRLLWRLREQPRLLDVA